MKFVFPCHLFVFLFFHLSPLLAQNAEIEFQGETAVFRSGGAEYHLDRSGILRSMSYRGNKLWYNGQGVVLKGPYGWIVENDSQWNESAGAPVWNRKQGTGELRLYTKTEGGTLRLIKQYTLRDQNPALDIEYHLSFRGSLFAEWGYMPLFNIENDNREWFHIGAEVINGKVTPRLFRYPESPFYDWNTGKPKTIGNEKTNWNTFALVGQYDRELDRGAVFSLLEEENGEITFFCGGSKNSFLSLRYPGIGPGKDQWVEKKVRFRITPFQGNAEQTLKSIFTDPYVAWMKKKDLLPSRQKTGKTHSDSNSAVGIWSDECSVKIFREEKEPAQTSDAITLSGARREGATFQIAVHPRRTALKHLALNITDLKQKTGELISNGNIRWNPLGYVRSDRILKGTQLIGDMPDILLEQSPVNCPAGKTQPFWIRINIPSDAPAGKYYGMIRLMSETREIASVPVVLNVWNFSLPDQPTLLSLINPWPHRAAAVYPHDAALRGRAYEQIRSMTVDAGGVWICRNGPQIEWDGNGGITKFNTEKFDREIEEYFRVTKAKYAVNSFARFGVGGAPFQKGYFGTLEEINTPVWEKRVAAFAKAFHAHLVKKGWLDKLILDVFDEPQKQWIPYLKKNLENVRKNAPGLKMTYPGHYHTELDGLIDYWQMLLYPEPAMSSPELQKHFRSIDSFQMVYNPSNFEENSSNSAMRGLYWWMWRMKISGWLQWCTTLWHTADNTPGWNAFNNASWIAAGPLGLRSTMRMEMCRKGKDDYEYLTLLADACRNAQDQKKNAVAAEAKALLLRAEKLTQSNGNLLPALQNAAELAELREAIGGFLDRQTSLK